MKTFIKVTLSYRKCYQFNNWWEMIGHEASCVRFDLVHLRYQGGLCQDNSGGCDVLIFTVIFTAMNKWLYCINTKKKAQTRILLVYPIDRPITQILSNSLFHDLVNQADPTREIAPWCSSLVFMFFSQPKVGCLEPVTETASFLVQTNKKKTRERKGEEKKTPFWKEV